MNDQFFPFIIRFMPPEDPYGRGGISLDNLLRKIPMEQSVRPQDCPYGKKCTYGNKCRFYHPDRGFGPQKSVTEKLKEQAEINIKEVASKAGRRQKQKLSRTTSLVVGDSGSSNLSHADIENQRSRVKHKLAQSVSCVESELKQSNYLDESRKKMEAAKLSAAFEKASKACSGSISNNEFLMLTAESKDAQSFDSQKRHSLRSSPVPDTCPVKHNRLTGSSSLPANTSKSSRTASPSHLTVPCPTSAKKLDDSERYISGHLELAKKLSDEGSESNFFSSPSSTRTSSPVGSGHGRSGDPRTPNSRGSLESLLDSPRSNSMTHSPLTDSIDFIPNLSVFQSQHSQYSNFLQNQSQYDLMQSGSLPFTSYDEHLTHEKNSGNILTTCPLVGGHCQDSVDIPELGVFQFSNGNEKVPYSPICETLPDSTRKHKPLSHGDTHSQHQILRKSLSTNSEAGSSVPSRPAVTNLSGHLALRPQHSAPIRDSVPPRQQNHQNMLDMSRQNSLSDPQINAGFSLFPPSQPTSAGYQMSEQDKTMLLHQQLQRQQHLNMQQQQRLQHQQIHQHHVHQQQQQTVQHHQFLHTPHHGISQQLGNSSQYQMTKHGINDANIPVMQHGGYQLNSLPPSGYPYHQPPGVFRTATQQYPTLQHQMQPFTAPFNNSQYHQQQYLQYHQQQLNRPQQQNPQASFTPAFTYSTASQHQHTHQPPLTSMPPMRSELPGNVPANHCIQQKMPPTSIPPSTSTSSTLGLAEDRAISPGSPKYEIYSHLVALFDEKLVRRVMNSHPDINKPDQLCMIILKYKQEADVHV